MIPAPNVTFSALDEAEIVDDALSVFILLSDGSLVGVCLPVAELLQRGHTVIEAADAPAYCEAPAVH